MARQEITTGTEQSRIEPLKDQQLLAFQRTINTLNPGIKKIEPTDKLGAILDFWGRAAQTIADLNNPPLRRQIINYPLFTGNNEGSGNIHTIYSLQLSNDRHLDEVRPETLKQLSEDFRLLRCFGNNTDPDRLMASIPLIAERQYGKEFGLAVEEQYDRFMEAHEKKLDTLQQAA